MSIKKGNQHAGPKKHLGFDEEQKLIKDLKAGKKVSTAGLSEEVAGLAGQFQQKGLNDVQKRHLEESLRESLRKDRK